MEAEHEEIKGRRLPLPLWRNRDYLLLWSGQAVSIIGSQVSQFALPLLILGVIHSPAQAGFISAVRIVPYLLLSLVAGALVDRWDRKRTMIIADAGRALALGSIPLALWTGHLSLLQLYLVSLVEGTLFVFFSLSQTAALPRIVGKEQLPAAMGQNEASYQLSSLVGPPLGGLLYSVGRLVPFLADAISYSASVLSLLFVRARFQGERARGIQSIRADIVEGLIWLWQQPLIRTIALLSSIAWIMLAALDLVVIVLARAQHAPPWAIGLIFGVGAVGGMLGALLASPIQRRYRFGQIIIGSAWLWALLWPLYALAPNVVALGVITAGLFLVWPLYNVTQMSYRLALIPDQLQGRVNSVFRLISFSGQPVGMALAGGLLQTVGPQRTVLILGIAPVCMAIGALFSKQVRKARPLAELRAA